MSKSSDPELQRLRAEIARISKQSPRPRRDARASDGFESEALADDAPREVDDWAEEPPDDRPDARELALRFLARREHGSAELARKLSQRGVTRDEAAEAIEAMAEAGWQSDARFAAQYASDHAARGDGPLKIRAALQARGVKDALIAQALETALDALDADWLELARRARCKRFEAEPPRAAAEQARQMRFLMARGFPSAIARQAMRPHDD